MLQKVQIKKDKSNKEKKKETNPTKSKPESIPFTNRETESGKT